MALQWGGDRLTNAGMLPTLKKLTTLPLKDPGSNAMGDYNRRAVKSAALMRWYQLEPQEARQEVLREIGSATPALTAESLSFLPESALTQFEAIWAQAYVDSGNDVLAGLLAQFGTGLATPQVAGKLKEIGGESHCEAQAAALAYLVKFDPDVARSLLRGVCHDVSLQDVSRYSWGPPLEELALRRVEEPNNRVASDALIYLQAYGTGAALAPLRERYSNWTHQAAAKAAISQGSNVWPSATDWDEIGGRSEPCAGSCRESGLAGGREVDCGGHERLRGRAGVSAGQVRLIVSRGSTLCRQSLQQWSVGELHGRTILLQIAAAA